MYQLNKFCNIICELRKKRGWTQTNLADKLGIAPQSISKWECGVGYPDVTMFPIIAELFDVPINVLFGETDDVYEETENGRENERDYVFEPLHKIELHVTNQCRIEILKEDGDYASLHIEGDDKFMEYLSVEETDGKLYVNVKNPTGSDKGWIPYDRGNYKKDNKIVLNTGREHCVTWIIRYLDLNSYEWETDDGVSVSLIKKGDL